MATTLAFDVYGTLIDTHGVSLALQGMVGTRAAEFSRHWRDKQLEYSFRRGLMQHYASFATCTRDALEYTCESLGLPLDVEQRQLLLDAYRTLPAFDDVKRGLENSRAAGFRMFAFSNGAADAVDTLLETAGIRGFFDDVVSCDEVKSFKPNPGVYAHFLRRAATPGASAWLVSSNPFDVIGAMWAGMRAAWVRRSPQAVFDPWGIAPSVTVAELTTLAAAIGVAD